MKLRIIIYLLFIFTCNSQNSDWHSSIKLSSEKLSSSKSLSYQAEYKIKHFDNSDTINFPKLNYYILKKPSDSILNFLVKINLIDYKQEKVYDGNNNFYTISHNEKAIEYLSIESFGKSIVKNNIFSDAIPKFLTKGFESMLKRKDIDVSINEIKDVNTLAWKIEFNFPTDDEITLSKQIIYIDQKTKLPYRLERFAKFMGLQDEYSSLEISNLKLDIGIGEDFFQLGDSLKEYSRKIITKESMANGVNNNKKKSADSITNFIGFETINSIGEKNKIESTFYNDKLVLIDFWHLACAPCLKAMPKLNELYKKYSGNGFIVLGLNPIDLPVEKEKIINQFLAKLKVDYTNMYVTKKTAEIYNVSSFPSFFLFKSGKLIYSKVGYVENGFTELENMIKNNLQ